MSYEIKGLLKQAVENFVWSEEVNQHPEINIDDLVTIVYARIWKGSKTDLRIAGEAGKRLSLLDVCYLIAEKTTGVNSSITIDQINQASQDVKTVLNQVFIRLSQKLPSIPTDELKAMTLLFGIYRVCELVAKTNLLPKETPTFGQLNILNQLIALRSRYDINAVGASEKFFLLKLSQQILEKELKLATQKYMVNKGFLGTSLLRQSQER